MDTMGLDVVGMVVELALGDFQARNILVDDGLCAKLDSLLGLELAKLHLALLVIYLPMMYSLILMRVCYTQIIHGMCQAL